MALFAVGAPFELRTCLRYTGREEGRAWFGLMRPPRVRQRPAPQRMLVFGTRAVRRRLVVTYDSRRSDVFGERAVEQAFRDALSAYLRAHQDFYSSSPQHKALFDRAIGAIPSPNPLTEFAQIFGSWPGGAIHSTPEAVVEYAKHLHVTDQNFKEALGKLEEGDLDRQLSQYPDRLRGLWLRGVSVDGVVELEGCTLAFLDSSAFQSKRLKFQNCCFDGGIFFEQRYGDLALVATTVGEARLNSIQGASNITIETCRIRSLRIRTAGGASVGNVTIAKSSIGDCDAGSSKYTGAFIIEDTSVAGRFDFRRATFESATVLNADFAFCPSFFDAVLSAETTFFGMRLGGRPVGLSSPRRLATESEVQRELLCVRHLRIEAQRHRWTRDEVRFFADEQRLERHLSSAGDRALERILSFLYDQTSRYGASVSRALSAFLLWNTAFGIGYFFLFHTALTVPHALVRDNSSLGAPWATLALQNAVNPLALFTEKAQVVVTSWPLLAASLVQTIGSVAIFALLLITLRCRFQRGSSGGGAGGS